VPLSPEAPSLASGRQAPLGWANTCSIPSPVANPQEIERLRRSIAMRGHSAGALTRESAMEMINDLARLDQLTARYRDTIAELRRVLEAFEPDS
jgi:hypothetical protein